MNRGCCGVRTFPDEAKALRVLGKITSLRQAEGGEATYSAATEAYECPRGNWHLREPAAAPARPAAPRDTGPDRVTREAVYIRDGRACVCCNTPIDGQPHSVGHRKRRSQGGGNGMSNLLTFLGSGSNPLDPDDHHARIDSRRNPQDEIKGFTVRSFRDPARIPVRYTERSGSWIAMYLDDEGNLSPDAPGAAA